MHIQPYLSFDGRAEEAIEFYKSALGARVLMQLRFKDNPEPPPPGQMTPGVDNKIMHASLKIGDSVVNVSDGRCTGKANFSGISMSLSVANDAEARRYFDALANGGKATMPLGKTFFSSSFGMLTDKFGVQWMVLVQQRGSA